MSKSPAPTAPALKLTGRSYHQTQAAKRYMGANVQATTDTTVTFKPGLTWAEVESLVKAAIMDAKREGQKGHSIALHSLLRAVGRKLEEAPAPTAVDAKAARTAEAALARNRAANRKAAATAKAKAAAKKAPRKPAANTQARLSKALKADASKATAVPGYQLRWPHGGYDLYRALEADAPSAWVVRCTAHGTTTPAPNAKAGDALGAKAARAAWCKPCKAEAKAAARKAPAKAKGPSDADVDKALRTLKAELESPAMQAAIAAPVPAPAKARKAPAKSNVVPIRKAAKAPAKAATRKAVK